MRPASSPRSAFVVAVVCACSLASAAAAQAQNRLHHWPNSPVRHPLRTRGAAVAPAFAANLRGGVVASGNTLLTCPGNLTASGRRRVRAGNEPCLGANNNDENMQYVNVDPTGHFDSSSATVSIPTGARVVKAYLYWGADLSRGVRRPSPNDASYDAPGGGDPTSNTQWRRALLSVGGGPYTTIDATNPLRDGRWDTVASWYSQPGNAPGTAYQVRADVTPELSRALAATRRRTHRGGPLVTATVANVQAGHGYNRYGGWSLIVVWEQPTAAWRDVTLFDGFAFVQVQGGQQLVVGPLDFTGFQTPASGKVDAHVTTWTYEGDRAITGDYMGLGGLSASCAGLKAASDDANPFDNFFNSTISAAGVTVPGRTPGYTNQLGFDLDALAVPEGTIPHSANGASVCLGTAGDTYFFGGIAFDTLIRAPNLQIAKTADRSQANPGDAVTYTTTVTNPQRPAGETPTEAATNLVIHDPLPSGLDFRGFTVNPGGVCSYNAAGRAIICNVGRVEIDGSFSFTYTATVNAAAQGPASASLINVGCYLANAEDQPDTEFTGCDTATVVVPPAPHTDLGVVKTVSADVVAPGATVTWNVVGTNHGPGTSTGFILADQLPAGVAFVSATHDAALTCTTPPVGSSGAVTCTAPSVAAGTSLRLEITATVPATTPDGTVLRNVATVNGDQNEPVPDLHPNRDFTDTRVVVPDEPIPEPPNPLPPEPSPVEPPVPPSGGGVLPEQIAGTRLSIHKSVSPSTVRPGGTAVVRLRVKNIGEASAIRVRVCDALPHGIHFVSGAGFTAGGQFVCRNVARIRIGVTRTFTLTVRVSRGARGVRTNRATARALNALRVSARAPIRITTVPSFTG